MSADPAAKLRKRLESLAAEAPSPDEQPRFAPTQLVDHPFADPVLEHLLHAFLVWEAGERRAASAPAKLAARCIDANDLRICLPSEIVAALGTTYPRAGERAERIRATLNAVFDREHEVSLASLAALGKREAKQYLDTLEGIPPYVAARTALLALDCHAFPIDDRLARLLDAEGCLPDDAPSADAQGWIERQLRAGEAPAMFLGLEAWAADRKPPAKTTKKAKASRTTKKATSRKRKGRSTSA
ncbi:MAG: hypothetical protein AAFR96_10885 [Planctomycetota bacterium]